MSKNLNTQWRVQVRKSRAHKWVNGGLYETRAVARFHAAWLREGYFWGDGKKVVGGYGFGNTRVVKFVKGSK